MRIGELAKLSGTSTRMLRYYESQGLLKAKRSTNGYRAFDTSDVERARSIASLIRSGVPTKLIYAILTAQDDPANWGNSCDLEFARLLHIELDTIDEKIACLTRSRAAVETYLECSGANTVSARSSTD
ncbi:MerR family transcriptional regulator [Brevibacterium sp. K11IcPPYGO002]|uniref:MerR family transcriptional regulator n=1 Tax=Brevibacterium sp. K11IcPPYGO002 TaxID=3058837 RepID=UPI003D819BF7